MKNKILAITLISLNFTQIMIAPPPVRPVGEVGPTSTHTNKSASESTSSGPSKPMIPTVPAKQPSAAQKYAIQARETIAKVSPFQNQGMIDYVANTKGMYLPRVSEPMVNAPSRLSAYEQQGMELKDMSQSTSKPSLVSKIPSKKTDFDFLDTWDNSNTTTSQTIQSPAKTTPLSNQREYIRINNNPIIEAPLTTQTNTPYLQRSTESLNISNTTPTTSSLSQRASDAINTWIGETASAYSRYQQKQAAAKGAPSEAIEQNSMNRSERMESAQKTIVDRINYEENPYFSGTKLPSDLVVKNYLKGQNQLQLLEYLITAPRNASSTAPINQARVWDAITSKISDATGLTALRSRLNAKDKILLDTEVQAATKTTSQEVQNALTTKNSTMLQRIANSFSQQLQAIGTKFGLKPQIVENTIMQNTPNPLQFEDFGSKPSFNFEAAFEPNQYQGQSLESVLQPQNKTTNTQPKNISEKQQQTQAELLEANQMQAATKAMPNRLRVQEKNVTPINLLETENPDLASLFPKDRSETAQAFENSTYQLSKSQQTEQQQLQELAESMSPNITSPTTYQPTFTTSRSSSPTPVTKKLTQEQEAKINVAIDATRKTLKDQSFATAVENPNTNNAIKIILLEAADKPLYEINNFVKQKLLENKEFDSFTIYNLDGTVNAQPASSRGKLNYIQPTTQSANRPSSPTSVTAELNTSNAQQTQKNTTQQTLTQDRARLLEAKSMQTPTKLAQKIQENNPIVDLSPNSSTPYAIRRTANMLKLTQETFDQLPIETKNAIINIGKDVQKMGNNPSNSNFQFDRKDYTLNQLKNNPLFDSFTIYDNSGQIYRASKTS